MTKEEFLSTAEPLAARWIRRERLREVAREFYVCDVLGPVLRVFAENGDGGSIIRGWRLDTHNI